MSKFWDDVRELAAMRQNIPPERRAGSGVRNLMAHRCAACGYPARLPKSLPKLKLALDDPDTAATYRAALRARDEVAAWPNWKANECRCPVEAPAPVPRSHDVQNAEPRVDNPEHDSLVLKFNQLERLIGEVLLNPMRAPARADRLVDAKILVQALRAQVLK